MANVLIEHDTLDELAEAIAAKSGEDLPLTLPEMIDAVDGITVQGEPEPEVQIEPIKAVSPAEEVRVVTPSSGYDAMFSVKVNAIPGSYVGSSVPRRDALSASVDETGTTVGASWGYYPSSRTLHVAGPPMVVNYEFTTNNTRVTFDKTYSQVLAAYQAGRGFFFLEIGDITAGAVLSHHTNYNFDGTTFSDCLTIQLDRWTGTVGDFEVYIVAYGLVNGSQTTRTRLQSRTAPSGAIEITQNGQGIDVSAYATANVNVSGGSAKNVQVNMDRKQRTGNSYGATGLSLTVAKTGVYTVSWTAWRSSSSGTMGTNLHRNATAGTNQQTFTGTYGQNPKLTNQSLNAGDVLTIYATSGSTSRSIYVANLIIEEQ
ncbi:MAG: hypothetical protein IKQ73_07605 [Oscillospiraceae bacterium]|nr:hypothetical protein [Oscillospiraceae bacterium]